jgi:hypothetical protein
MKYDFKTDLKFGNDYEIKAFEQLKKYKNNDNLTCIYNNDYKFDFKTNENKTYEIKADKMSLTTGNFFIEYWCNFKPSGICKTKADYYIITDTINYYMVPTSDIVNYINNEGPPTKAFKSDVGLVKGYLIKINEFIKIKNLIKI